MERPPNLDTRGRILQAALDLFAAHGYQRTPLRAIADRLGMTKAGVLYHFPSKEHLLAALTEPLLSDLEATLDRAARLPWPDSRWAALVGWLDTLLRHRRPLGTLYHDMTLIARGATYTRILRLAQLAYSLVAGAEPSRLEQIRAVQAVATLGDPIVFFAHVPDDQLRAEMLDGVARLLGEPPPGWPAEAARSTPDKAAAPGGIADRIQALRTAPERARAEPHPAGPPEAARTRVGRRTAGRPRALSAEQVRTALTMRDAGTHSVEEIAATFGVSRATVYRQLRDVPASPPSPAETVFEPN